jgi:hypothetical protein
MVRIGGNCKDEVVEAYSLAKMNASLEYESRKGAASLYQEMDLLAGSLESCEFDCKNNVLTWKELSEYVRVRNHDHFSYLQTLHNSILKEKAEGWVQAKSKKKKNSMPDAIDVWVEGNHPIFDVSINSNKRADRSVEELEVNSNKRADRSIEELEVVHNIWGMSLSERRCLFASWKEDFLASKISRLQSVSKQILKVTKQLESLHNGAKMNYLRNAEIVGVTTTGAAKYQELLSSLGANVLVCEEAGEVSRYIF